MFSGPKPEVAFAQPTQTIVDVCDHLLVSPLSVWLDVVRRADLTMHYDVLAWIVEQPECDANIAQLIFYRANPARHIRNRMRMDPVTPNRQALCVTIVRLAHAGRFSNVSVGLKWSELDQPRNDLIRALQDVSPCERVFDVPDLLLAAHDHPETTLDDLWCADHDVDIHDLYVSTGLAHEDSTKCSHAAGPKADSVLGDFVSMLRPPTANSA